MYREFEKTRLQCQVSRVKPATVEDHIHLTDKTAYRLFEHYS